MNDQVSDVDTSGQSDGPGTAVAVASDAPPVVAADAHVALGDAHDNHPTERQYVLIAVVLVVITSIEIATSYLNTGHTNLIIVALFLMAAIKFFLVAAWYMHMKTDQPFFRRIFVTGMVGAGIVYGIVMFVFSSTVLKT
ncbi:MAG TPA: cytochrome C oxidase subunit IV family protein [Acidimicrobiia bacterium]|jgi:cytochrome c oxidase subunit 4|nr:cytochrome C oxidase subunit IV family protein [Acidimicrobiia bacterium]